MRSRIVKLRDGSRVRLRSITPEDRELIADLLGRMSAESRYRRFFHYVTELSSQQLTYLTDVDHVDHEAIIAIDLDGGQALGVARFVRRLAEPESAEVAFSVVDDWQGRGLGRALVTALTARARQEGVTRFYAQVQYGNERSVAMLKGIGAPETRAFGPERELAVELPAERGIGVQLASLLRGAAEGAIQAGQSIAMQVGVDPRRVARPWSSISTVVVGTDGSDAAAVAVQAAVEVAARFEATLHIVSAYRAAADRPAGLTRVSGLADAAREQGVAAEGHAILGEPTDALLHMATECAADLLVVGSKGLTGPTSVFGSIPNSVFHHADCSVLVVRTA